MTMKHAAEEARKLGFTLKHVDGEYVVYPVGEPAHAYFAGDLEDALGTARIMAAERGELPVTVECPACGSPLRVVMSASGAVLLHCPELDPSS